jgi:hypothetical protein
MLLQEPIGQCLAQLHRLILALGESDQLFLPVRREHPLERLFGPPHPFLAQMLPFLPVYCPMRRHPWLLSIPPPKNPIISNQMHSRTDVDPVASGGSTDAAHPDRVSFGVSMIQRPFGRSFGVPLRPPFRMGDV